MVGDGRRRVTRTKSDRTTRAGAPTARPARPRARARSGDSRCPYASNGGRPPQALLSLTRGRKKNIRGTCGTPKPPQARRREKDRARHTHSASARADTRGKAHTGATWVTAAVRLPEWTKSSQLATPPTERDSVRVAVAEQAPNRGHSVPSLFGAELWISWFCQNRAARGTQRAFERAALESKRGRRISDACSPPCKRVCSHLQLYNSSTMGL